MACYHPMKAFWIGTTENGKKDLKVTGYDAQAVVRRNLGDNLVAIYDVPHGVDRFRYSEVYTHFDVIPCGQCIGCRIDYSRTWAVRCMLESEYHDENWFLTLTYDDEHVPWNDYVDKETGELKQIQTLVKSDVQKFHKRLRSRLEYMGLSGFSYFCAGEYGDRTARPHYHDLAFGLPLSQINDFEKWKDTQYGTLYTSKFLDGVWQNGRVIIGDVTYRSCAYVARYIVKKKKGKASGYYTDYNLCPEFTLVSKSPSVGKKYFNDHFDSIYRLDSIVLSLDDSGVVCVRPPRIYDEWMKVVDEELVESNKLQRKALAEELQKLKAEFTDMDFHMMNAAAERNLESRVSCLVRCVD